MAEDEEDPRRRFRLIEGLPEKPRPREASWPRRYRVVRVRRSVRRPRSGPYKAKFLEEIGVLLRESKPGSSRLRRGRRRRAGAPPWRTEKRKARDRLRAANQEELDRMVAEAWQSVMELRGKFAIYECIDPDGTGGWNLPSKREERRTYRPRSWEELRAGRECRIAYLPGIFRIESVDENDGRPFATLVDEHGVRREVRTLEFLDLCEATTAEEGTESLFERLLADYREHRLGRGLDPDG